MGRFVVTLLLLALSLSISFVSGTNCSLSKNYDLNEESETVLMQAEKEEVLGCTLEVENKSGDFESFPLYDKNKPTACYDMFNFIGAKDKSCSFITYPKNKSFNDTFKGYDALKKQWTMIERYSCEKSIWNIVSFNYDWKRGGCYRKYIFFFYPTSDFERKTMDWGTTKIIRKATYDNKTLTVLFPSDDNIIYKCELQITPQKFKWFESNINIIYRRSSLKSSPDTGIEYIGSKDNSCSLRIHLDVLNAKNITNDILNRPWLMTVKHWDSRRVQEKLFGFYMNPKNWWIDNHYSQVRVRGKYPFGYDLTYF